MYAVHARSFNYKSVYGIADSQAYLDTATWTPQASTSIAASQAYLDTTTCTPHDSTSFSMAGLLDTAP